MADKTAREQAREVAASRFTILEIPDFVAEASDAASDVWEPLLREACERYVRACTQPGEPITEAEARFNIHDLLEALDG